MGGQKWKKSKGLHEKLKGEEEEERINHAQRNSRTVVPFD